MKSNVKFQLASKTSRVGKTPPTQSPKPQGLAFGPDNYKWMLIGLAVIVIGFALMHGKTDDIFNSSEALRSGSFSFSTHIKITVAPLVVLAGFVIEVYAIMRRPRTAE